MSRQETVRLIDDIDGMKAHETVAFGLDGASYEIDLHSRKAAALRKSLAIFVAAGRKQASGSTPRPLPASDRRRRRKRTANEPSSAEVRAWALEAGVTAPGRGRVPAALIDHYLAAHDQQLQQQPEPAE